MGVAVRDPQLRLELLCGLLEGFLLPPELASHLLKVETLAAGFEERLGIERIYHGFLVLLGVREGSLGRAKRGRRGHFVAPGPLRNI